MMNITIRQLRYFEALARQGHFGEAAKTCAISQPALSVQIKELEATLGSVLFERGPRHARLTSLGEELLVRVRHILRSVDELGDLARAAQDQLVGQLRIGIIPTIAPYLLPAILEGLSEQYSRVDIHIRETMTSTLLQELADGRIDMAIVALPISEPSLTEVALFEENFVFIRPLADADKPVPDSSMLQEMRLLLLEEGHCFRDQALSFCNIQPNQPRGTLDGTTLSTLVQMVAAGMGVTLIPKMAIEVETRSAAVAVAHFDEPQPSRTIGLIWRSSNPLAKQFLQVSESVRLSAESLGK